MEAEEELDLVFACVCEARTTSNCLEWRGKASARVRADPHLKGLTPGGIRRMTVEHVLRVGKHAILQKREKRQEYSETSRFIYHIIVPCNLFRHGLFVELDFVEVDDQGYPVVDIVNAHEQLKS